LRVSGKIFKQENPYIYGQWVVLSENSKFMAPSIKLGLTRFSTKLRIQDGAECGNRPLKMKSLANQLQILNFVFFFILV